MSTLGLVAGSAAYRIGAVWWDQKPAPDFAILSRREVVVADAIAEAMFPGDHLGMPSGTEVRVVETLDEYLSAIPGHKANLLRLLLHAIDDVAVVADLGMTRFHRRPRDERVEILAAWDDSRIDARREAFEGLKLILSMGYCEAPEVISAAGIDYECGAWR